MNEITPNIMYLLGLIYGRGRLYDKKVIIEFAHKNRDISGIFRCKICHDIVTKSKSEKKYICKGCQKDYGQDDLSPKYEQVRKTQSSLRDVIIPFLALEQHDTGVEYKIIANNVMTLLVIDFQDENFFNLIKSFYNAGFYKNFTLDERLKQLPKEDLIELVNGIFDTAGFPAVGNWLNRPGKLSARMRIYLQIVGNWQLVIDIDELLRTKFKIPVQTIDWGHPNIRDSNLKDFYDSSPTSWSREHQLKFFPEYYEIFRFRLNHKQALFHDLLNFNKEAGFDNLENWFPPKGNISIKPSHPGENDKRLPLPVRRHFDAFWQINLALNSPSLVKLVQDNGLSKEAFFYTGDIEKAKVVDVAEIKRQSESQSLALYHNILNQRNSTPSVSATNKTSDANDEQIKEIDLYEPLINWLDSELKSNSSNNHVIYNVSAHNFNFLLNRNADDSIIEMFEYCQDFQIKPDIVALIPEKKTLALIEAKITSLNIENLGQLLAYCLVSQPELAILISTKPISQSLMLAIESNPDVLKYVDNQGNTKKIKIAQWVNNTVVFKDFEND